MGAMAVTLAQTLGQNLGMMWNKHRSSAGINEDPLWPHNQPRPIPSSSRREEGVCGRGAVIYSPLYPPGSPLRGLQVSGQLAGLHHGGYRVSSWEQTGGGFGARRVLEQALGGSLDTTALRGLALRTTQDSKKPRFLRDLAQGDPDSLAGHPN